MKKPEPISSLLDGIISRKKWSHKLDLHQVFVFWEEVVGGDVSRWARPSIIRGRVLWISVADSVWMQQLYMQKLLLLEKINERLPDAGFSDLRFQVDSNMIHSEPEPEKTAGTVGRQPTPEESRIFRKAIDTIPDPQVRDAFFNYWCKVKNARK